MLMKWPRQNSINVLFFFQVKREIIYKHRKRNPVDEKPVSVDALYNCLENFRIWIGFHASFW